MTPGSSVGKGNDDPIHDLGRVRKAEFEEGMEEAEANPTDLWARCGEKPVATNG